MSYLRINHDKIDGESAAKLIKLCPFNAITYNGDKLSISSGCKMCKMCVKKGNGEIEFIEEKAKEIDKSLWRGVCVYVDRDEDNNIHPVALELIGKARELASVTKHPVYALIIGSDTTKSAEKLLHYGVDKVYCYDDKAFEHFNITPYANAFEDFINKVKPSSILVGATNIGRSLAPKVAARFKTGLTADCTMLEMKESTDLVQIRPAFGGDIMAQIVTPNNRPQFCTVRYKIFSAPEVSDTVSGEIVQCAIGKDKLASNTEILNVVRKAKEMDISDAEVIVSVGRGLKSKADMAMIEELADLLDAQLACTRPLIESGWFDPRRQIGLSGRTVKPKLIFAIAISGAVQYTAGMSNSDCIVAINSDPTAPIFGTAHYGVVGDLYEVVPKLISGIKGERKYV